MRSYWMVGRVLVLALALGTEVYGQQVQRLPLAPRPPTGEPVAPFFEGWYRNTDGTFTFSFGYYEVICKGILS